MFYQIHLNEPPSDILIGQEEIELACELLNERMESLGLDVSEQVILPVHPALPSGYFCLCTLTRTNPPI